MYRFLIVTAALSAIQLAAPAAASEYAGSPSSASLGRLAFAGLLHDPSTVGHAPQSHQGGPLRPFLQLHGDAGQDDSGATMEALAAGLQLDGGDWRLKGEVNARNATDSLVPTLRLESRWSPGPSWLISGQFASLPLEEALEIHSGNLSLAARHKGRGGAWNEVRMQRKASAGGWSESLELRSHRPLLSADSEQLFFTGRLATRENPDSAARDFSVSLDHRWQAWAFDDQRMEQQLTVAVGGRLTETEALPVGRIRYGHLWVIGDALDFEYAIERQRSPVASPTGDDTTLSLGIRGNF